MVKRIMLIGLDGATWNLIMPWVVEGELPTFRYLLEKGAWGTLKSTIPPITPVAWASLLTGKTPGKTGIYDFFYLEEKFPPRIKISSGVSIRRSSLITILSKEGIKILAINIPMTYPPYKVNGILITGIETPPGAKFAYPNEIYDRLVRENYFPEPRIHYVPGHEKRLLTELYKNINKRNKILFELWDSYDYDVLLFFLRETDIASHIFWRFLDSNHPLHVKNNELKRAILITYKAADQLIRKILRKKQPNDLLIVFSDHGFGPEYFRVNLNNWLFIKGYITLKHSPRTYVKKILNYVITPSNIWNILARFRLKSLSHLKAKHTSINTQDLLSKLFLNINDIDWDKTLAFSFGSIGRHLPIFINDNFPINLVKKKLKKDILLLNTFLGRSVIKRVINFEEIYTKDQENRVTLPDLFVAFKIPYAGYTLPPPYLFEGSSILSPSPVTQTGAHTRDGIIALIGSDIKIGKHGPFDIVDIAPTILALLSIEIPEDIDGRVLIEVFSKKVQFNIVKRHDKMVKIKKRIRKVKGKL